MSKINYIISECSSLAKSWWCTSLRKIQHKSQYRKFVIFIGYNVESQGRFKCSLFTIYLY